MHKAIVLSLLAMFAACGASQLNDPPANAPRVRQNGPHTGAEPLRNLRPGTPVYRAP